MYVVGCTENSICLINRFMNLMLLRGYIRLRSSLPKQENVVTNQRKDYHEWCC